MIAAVVWLIFISAGMRAWASDSSQPRPNILLILVDDLGYGDLSVAPFTGTGIRSPELEKMAKNGAIMTNFHSAAPICSPSRASILTGLFSWRVGIAGVYEYGRHNGESNRNDWMNLMPTSAMAFRDAGYYTAHVGKWHLGGMRGTDLEERVKGNKCSHPGPNQMGFEEYISMTEGPSDPRQQYLQKNARLHSEGGKYLIRNDSPYPCRSEDTLSNCEAKEAIRIMKETKEKKIPFYMHVWMETPHGK
jgi:arylsulfatase A